MKSPRSADFPWNDSDSVTQPFPDTFLLVSHVDAKNAFGAEIRTRYSCAMAWKGGDPRDFNSYLLKKLTFE